MTAPSKYKGIDGRHIKCCDPSPKTIEAGISFRTEGPEHTPALVFHFLEDIGLTDEQTGAPLLHQAEKSMWLDRENTKELIAELRRLKFKNKKKK